MVDNKKSKLRGKRQTFTVALAASEAVEQSEATVIPVVHEHLQIGKRQVVKSKVKLHKTVEEHLETTTLSLQSESVDIVRVPKDEIVSAAAGSRREDDTLILPIYEEVLMVEKRLRLVEEIHITMKKTVRDEVQKVLLRQEKVRLEKDGKELSLLETRFGR
jgi:uncharacterized protein (TIGR02271 family)